MILSQFGGFDEDDEGHFPPAAGPGGFMGLGLGGGPGWGGPSRRANPRQYDEYFKAYSVAMMPSKERANLSYGGKSEFPTRTTTPYLGTKY